PLPKAVVVLRMPRQSSSAPIQTGRVGLGFSTWPHVPPSRAAWNSPQRPSVARLNNVDTKGFEVMKGRVRFTSPKGFGFVLTDENESLFYHVTSSPRGTLSPVVGDHIEFDIKRDGAKGPQAVNCRVVDGSREAKPLAEMFPSSQ